MGVIRRPAANEVTAPGRHRKRAPWPRPPFRIRPQRTAVPCAPRGAIEARPKDPAHQKPSDPKIGRPKDRTEGLTWLTELDQRVFLAADEPVRKVSTTAEKDGEGLVAQHGERAWARPFIQSVSRLERPDLTCGRVPRFGALERNRLRKKPFASVMPRKREPL